MKHFVMTGVLAFALCSGAYAENGINSAASGTAAEEVTFEEAGGSGEKDIEGDETAAGPQSYGTGVNEAGVMPSYESYDDNTGLPNYVPSDTTGEIDD